MLIGVDNNQGDSQINDDNFLLVDESGKNNDIIDSGEVIAGNIGKFKCIQPGVLACQLNNLQLQYKDEIVQGLNTVSKCIAIEGVEISNEELEALKEAAMAKREAEDGVADAFEEAANIGGKSGMSGSMQKDAGPMSKPNVNDLQKEMDNLKMGMQGMPG